MNREYHKWYSGRLNRDMELLVFGHAGTPVLVFPTSMGTFFEYEGHGMVGAMWDIIERGSIQLFCVDSIDGESWYNRGAHPADKIERHMQYESYIREEVLPFLRDKNWSPRIATTGASFGAYHAMNFALKNPDLISACIAMSGAFDIRQFLHGFYNDSAYFNNPVDFASGLQDPLIWKRHYILAAGDWDICLGETLRLDGVLGQRQIPHTTDIWGGHQKHDWPLWQQMARKYFG